ncbi:hypothetical protein [Methanobacterium sp. BAmetb5]|uniref:hypothetical protein n=1 Tax=Methanobacterium sp. BAmetb5 TaxID=2025351 RepID=UPI000E8C3605|nr:hypothetical protein [Methanobacterium sp. BAmetb5]AXV40889.1 MAG: hypothetical protein CIT02_11460 [Methanobacterium sp. BAmetb5]
MKKRRINTTISQEHYKLLKKHVEKHGTQQKVLETAIECLENNSKQYPPLSIEEKFWMRIGREIKDLLVIFNKNTARMLLETADIEGFREYVNDQKPLEFTCEWWYNKPIKELSLQELVDGIIMGMNILGPKDTINHIENDDCHTIIITNNLGINMAKIMAMEFESLFKSYNTQAEIHFSKRAVFLKIFKRSND